MDTDVDVDVEVEVCSPMLASLGLCGCNLAGLSCLMPSMLPLGLAGTRVAEVEEDYELCCFYEEMLGCCC